MMTYLLRLDEVTDADGKAVGGKCRALAAMARQGFLVPRTVCITTEAYERYVSVTGLRPRILLELNRKPFSDMRWEEIWDAALRIRSMFLKKEPPGHFLAALRQPLEAAFADAAVVVRSSAPGEDAAGSSFAGLHESYVNVRGVDAILEHVRRVWASLWSDAALLYRRELGLDVAKSAMAVLVQEIVIGDRSGVAFSCSPEDRSQGIIECVYGLNQGLVDGTIEPDRWILDRKTETILSHVAALRDRCLVPAGTGVRQEVLPPEKAGKTPLADREVVEVFRTALASEHFFGSPQDLEWTFRKDALFALQSRPITTLAENGRKGGRGWYLSLRRSFDHLVNLRHRIETELVPAMTREAQQLERSDPERLSDRALSEEIARRIGIHGKWTDVYWTEFIPFAHGARLFGQAYNDAVRPEDPHEFMELLGTSELKSLVRNRMLGELAETVRADPALRDALARRSFGEMEPEFYGRAAAFIRQFTDPGAGYTNRNSWVTGLPEDFTAILLEMAAHPVQPRADSRNVGDLEYRFLECFQGEDRRWAEDLLDLARASYRLRDDDNMYLGAVERQMQRAVTAGKNRLAARDLPFLADLSPEDVARALADPGFRPAPEPVQQGGPQAYRVKARQLTGQPAGPGLAAGRARIVLSASDAAGFKHGEILVCDAVDPNMTMVVPLAVGIVERRGGMLIHGAIIAREYGLACVTGVAGATERIRTGERLTVDGYLGIVTIG